MRSRFVTKGPKFKRIRFDSSGRRYTEHFRLQRSNQAPKEEASWASLNDDRSNFSSVTVEDIANGQCTSTHPSVQGDNSYSKKKKQLSDSWKSVRERLLIIRTEELSPSTFCCCRCGVETQQIIRCQECSHLSYYCQECWDDVHRTVLFHVPSIWKGMMFVPYTKRLTPVLVRHQHNCSTTYLREVCIVDVKGVQHKAKLQFCSCEEESATVLRFGLWPATPVRPRVVFQLDLMELSASLQLEGGLSTKSFCDSLRYVRRPQIYDVQEVKNVYRVLVGDCANEYRYHRTLFDQGRHLGLDNVCCPACTQGSTFQCTSICVDANFGLVHKKGSGPGQGLQAVRHQDSFFYNQEDVDNFVESYKSNPKATKDCSSFQAGNVLRSKVKNAKLDFTGVFGSVCKHDFPIKFCNLRYGERLAYAVYFMEKIRSANPSDKIVFMYDIACLLFKHLKLNKRDDLLSDYIFAVPVFHSFAHNTQCQLQFGQRNVESTGLADGEGTERLWSYLRIMSKITKEMSLDNRHDLLVDSLHHYAMKLQSSLGDRIVTKHKKAISVRDTSLEHFRSLEIDGEIASMDKIRRMHEEFRKHWITRSKSSDNVDVNDNEEYCWLLKQDFNTREKLRTSLRNSEAERKFKNDLDSIEKKLRQKEKRLQIHQRWGLNDEQCRLHLEAYMRKMEKFLKCELKLLAVERQTLLNSMKKYADGQAIALRIGKQLHIVNNKLSTKLVELNNIVSTKKSFQDVCTPLSEYYCDTVLVSMMQDHIKTVDTYGMYLRAIEEIQNSHQDMKNVVRYFDCQGQKMKSDITKVKQELELDPTKYNKSNLFFLMLAKLKNEHIISGLQKSFGPYIGSFECDTSVTDYVLQCMEMSDYLPVVESVNLQESLDIIQMFENENEYSDSSSEDESE